MQTKLLHTGTESEIVIVRLLLEVRHFVHLMFFFFNILSSSLSFFDREYNYKSRHLLPLLLFLLSGWLMAFLPLGDGPNVCMHC